MARSRRATREPASADDERTDEMSNTDFVENEAEVSIEPTYDELKAKVAELEKALEVATKTKPKKDKPEKRKPDLPDGYIAPVAFRHKLVDLGLANNSMSPVQIYGLVRKASSNGMPVKHFDKAGNVYDEIQVHPITNETLTRPGLIEEEALEWWKNRPKRQPGQPKKEADSDESGEEADTLEDAAAAEADELDEDFAEAE